MKKILFIISDIYSLGGAQAITRNLANELSKYYEITILNTQITKRINYNGNDHFKVIDYDYRKNIGFATELMRKFVIFSWINNIVLPSAFVENGLYSRKYLSKIGANKFDYIVGVEFGGAVMASLLKLYRLTSAKIIGWQHSSFDAYFKTNNYGYLTQKKLFNKIYPCFDKYVVLLPRDKELCCDLFEKISVIDMPNFIDNVSYNHANREKIIISVGRLVKVKQFDLLIKAFSLIDDNEYKLFIVGEGSERQNLETLIDALGLKDRICLVGYVKNVNDYLAKSSIFACTSKYEGFSLALLESMSAGIPSVSFDFDAAKYLSGKDDSICLIHQNDFIAFSKELSKLCRNKEYYLQKSLLVRRRSNDFAKEKVVNKWVEMIKEL